MAEGTKRHRFTGTVLFREHKRALDIHTHDLRQHDTPLRQHFSEHGMIKGLRAKEAHLERHLPEQVSFLS